MWNALPGSNTGLGSGNTAENNSSVVLRVQYGEHVFLFMGDAEGKDRGDPADPPQYVEKILRDTVLDQLDATVLKIAHQQQVPAKTKVAVVSSGRALIVHRKEQDHVVGCQSCLATLNYYKKLLASHPPGVVTNFAIAQIDYPYKNKN
jgi:hypothetical protein